MECTQGLIVGGGGKRVPEKGGGGFLGGGGGREKGRGLAHVSPIPPLSCGFGGWLWDDVALPPYIRVEPCAVHRIFHQFRGRIFLCGGLDKRGCIVYSNSS